ncbi:MAG TPA: MFS transporter [Caulobacterales bacterium]|nr:MFS transporter [Caulobacterales bacterium]
MMTSAASMPHAHAEGGASISTLAVIGLTAFLTVVDLFATQAILPALASHYGVSASAMGVAVNASTIGMAISGLAVATFGQTLDRRLGVAAALLVLAVPTALLASAPNLLVFTTLRLCQGLLMSAAFALTLAHLGEQCSARASAGAFAAYVTGNVASNLFGRLIAAGLVDHFGVATNFYAFAALNIAGALLAFVTMRAAPAHAMAMDASPLGAIRTHLANPALRTAYAIGFLILFVFIGVFTYINFVLVRPPLALGMMGVGFVYFVFAPSILSTPLASRVVARLGARTAIWLGFAVAALGLPLLLAPTLPAVLAGMVLVACGTFFAQAVATGFVSVAAYGHRSAASGLYLASYFLGGMTGSALLGQIFDRFGWSACVGGVAAALALAAVLARNLRAAR